MMLCAFYGFHFHCEQSKWTDRYAHTEEQFNFKYFFLFLVNEDGFNSYGLRAKSIAIFVLQFVWTDGIVLCENSIKRQRTTRSVCGCNLRSPCCSVMVYFVREFSSTKLWTKIKIKSHETGPQKFHKLTEICFALSRSLKSIECTEFELFQFASSLAIVNLFPCRSLGFIYWLRWGVNVSIETMDGVWYPQKKGPNSLPFHHLFISLSHCRRLFALFHCLRSAFDA